MVQAAPAAFDREATLDEGPRPDRPRPPARGAGLIVFPEAFVRGYPRGLDFGARVGSRTAEGREAFRRYWDERRRRPRPGHRRPRRLAPGSLRLPGHRRHRARRRHALLLGPVLRARRLLLGKHRKLMPTAAERLVWGFGDGSTMPVFETPIGRLGAVICWENYMPLLACTCTPRASRSTAPRRPTTARSGSRRCATSPCEGRCFVLSCNQYALRGDYPADYPAIQGDDPGDRDVAGRELHRRPARPAPGRAGFDGAGDPRPPTSTSTRSPGASTTSTSSATTPAPTSSRLSVL